MVFASGDVFREASGDESHISRGEVNEAVLRAFLASAGSKTIFRRQCLGKVGKGLAGNIGNMAMALWG